jgi:hypothetical protein
MKVKEHELMSVLVKQGIREGLYKAFEDDNVEQDLDAVVKTVSESALVRIQEFFILEDVSEV